MKPEFEVTVLKFSELKAFEGTWQSADFVALLDAMEYGDTTGLSAAESREMCILSMQDLPVEDAAALLLTHKLSDHLNSGQIENAAHDMPDKKMWEEYANMALHEQMFVVGSLLHEAFPSACPEPDAVRLELEIIAANSEARRILEQPLHESFIVRLLAAGMEQNAVLHRMFDTQIAGAAFPEADKIVWTVTAEPFDGTTVRMSVTSSGYWLDPLRGTQAYTCKAEPDD